jgi:chorismate mutase
VRARRKTKRSTKENKTSHLKNKFLKIKTMKDIQPIFDTIDTEGKPLVIAGPCSAETEEQVLTTARGLAAAGIKIFRAGIWKPRTHPGGFEGVGAEGLQWLKRVKEETGMLVTTEVATRSHVYAALDAGIDILWIGARTSANPFAMQEIADALAERAVDVPVLVKNPVNPDLELWIGAMQRIYNAGIHRIGAIHRGFSAYGKHMYRNMPQWHIPIELRRRYPNLPIICDPSHMGGKRELVAPIAQQALDMGFDGLIIESHCNPDCAWSDKDQQVTPEVLNLIVNTLVQPDKTQSTESLSLLRQEIDRIDNELLEVLNRRMRISREIGQYKKEHSMPVLQTKRYDTIMNSRVQAAEEMGMSPDFMRVVLSAIHEESVRQQVNIFDRK